MGIQFFGEFLIDRWVITRGQLIEALELQDYRNLKFGEVAMQKKYLSEEQVKRINEEQKRQDIQFADLAVALGELNEAQAREILTLQKNNHLFLGESLLELGHVTEDILERELSIFKEEQERLKQRYSPSRVEDFYDPPVCVRCAEKGPTCCCASSEDIIAPLSDLEVERILTNFPWAAGHHFLKEIRNSRKFLENIERLFCQSPENIRQIFPPDGTHYQLATDDLGQCAMLGAYGCLLPVSGRPFFCRLYPFWFNGPQPQVFHQAHCLALQECDSVPELCHKLGTDPETLHDLYTYLCRAWGLSPSIQYRETAD